MGKTRITKKNKPSKVSKYHLQVFIGSQEYNCDTDDIVEAIASLKPAKITNKVRVIVTSGDKKIEKLLFVMPARRVFNIRMATEFFVKNIKLALK